MEPPSLLQEPLVPGSRRTSKNRFSQVSDRWNRALEVVTDKVKSQRNDNQPSEPSERWSRVLEAVSEKVKLRRREQRVGTLSAEPLQVAINDGWTSRHHGRYRQVSVLLTYWDDDVQCDQAKQAAEQLEIVFTQKYDFHVITWPIPIGNCAPGMTLSEVLVGFMRVHGQEGNLLIFWYGGPARLTAEGTGRTFWHGKNPEEMVISSGLVIKTLAGLLEAQSCKADILTLYDCPHALNDVVDVSRSGIFEHLGATSNDDFAPWNHPGCFSRSLIAILNRDHVIKHGLSVADIHREMLKRSANIRKTMFKHEASKKSHRSESPTAAASLSLCTRIPPPPVYCHLSTYPVPSKNESGSIVLSGRGYPLEYFSVNPGNKELQVQLTVTSNNDRLDIARWRNWAQNAPPQVEKIHIQRIKG
ncbi:hypothetical protein BJ166DRAFT_621823 [Pestalotiopsis sp. NC0098]|nr:hypothetical protein BJ166DRAFT_621823 [Pestalotiopsis sp. NC0098]